MTEEEKFQIEKVHNKIPTWFKVDKQHQINSRILLRFLELHSTNPYVSFESLKQKCIVDMPFDKFKSNYSQMINFGTKNNGKIFDDTEGFIKLWQPVEQFILHEYSKITNIPTYSSIIYPDDLADEKLYEGAKKKITVNSYERNSQARQACLKEYGYKCSICNFDFEKVYGEIGKNFIHVHHVKPLSEINEKYHIDPIKDLRPVCPNCHAMLHKKTPAFSIEDIKNRLNI